MFDVLTTVVMSAVVRRRSLLQSQALAQTLGHRLAVVMTRLRQRTRCPRDRRHLASWR